jgi:hypothetical protein
MGVMRNVYRVQSMTPSTALVGLLAADTNLSPMIVEGNLWLAEQELDAVLLPLQPGPDEDPWEAAALLAGTVPLRGVIEMFEPDPEVDQPGSGLSVTDMAHTTPAGSIAEALAWLLRS